MEILIAVAYRSRALRPMRARELDQLLIGARAFNEKAGISGALLHHQGEFLQYFEGTPPSVDRVYARIRSSHLHEQLAELMHEPIATRQFPRWHMAFADPTMSALEEIANDIWTMALPKLRTGDVRSPGLQHLLDFWDRTRQDT